MIREHLHIRIRPDHGAQLVFDEHGNAYRVPGPFRDLDHIRREHRDRGGYYFETETNRFFDARYAPEVYAGCMFVDSIRIPGMQREYRVKIIGTGRAINTVKDGFTTLAAARAWAVKVADLAGVLPSDLGAWDFHEWGSVND